MRLVPSGMHPGAALAAAMLNVELGEERYEVQRAAMTGELVECANPEPHTISTDCGVLHHAVRPRRGHIYYAPFNSCEAVQDFFISEVAPRLAGHLEHFCTPRLTGASYHYRVYAPAVKNKVPAQHRSYKSSMEGPSAHRQFVYHDDNVKGRKMHAASSNPLQHDFVWQVSPVTFKRSASVSTYPEYLVSGPNALVVDTSPWSVLVPRAVEYVTHQMVGVHKIHRRHPAIAVLFDVGDPDGRQIMYPWVGLTDTEKETVGGYCPLQTQMWEDPAKILPAISERLSPQGAERVMGVLRDVTTCSACNYKLFGNCGAMVTLMGVVPLCTLCAGFIVRDELLPLSAVFCWWRAPCGLADLITPHGERSAGETQAAPLADSTFADHYSPRYVKYVQEEPWTSRLVNVFWVDAEDAGTAYKISSPSGQEKEEEEHLLHHMPGLRNYQKVETFDGGVMVLTADDVPDAAQPAIAAATVAAEPSP